MVISYFDLTEWIGGQKLLACILELREFDGMLASFVWSHFHSRVVRIPLEAWEADGWATHFICRRMAGHKKEQKWTERDWAAALYNAGIPSVWFGSHLPLLWYHDWLAILIQLTIHTVKKKKFDFGLFGISVNRPLDGGPSHDLPLLQRYRESGRWAREGSQSAMLTYWILCTAKGKPTMHCNALKWREANFCLKNNSRNVNTIPCLQLERVQQVWTSSTYGTNRRGYTCTGWHIRFGTVFGWIGFGCSTDSPNFEKTVEQP